MMNLRITKSNLIRFGSWLLFSFFLVAVNSYAGSVHSCREYSKKRDKSNNNKQDTKCVVKMSDAKVGDLVEIRNKSNYIVAEGRVVGRHGRYGLVAIGRKHDKIRSGFFVVLKNHDSNSAHWTATASPY